MLLKFINLTTLLFYLLQCESDKGPRNRSSDSFTTDGNVHVKHLACLFVIAVLAPSWSLTDTKNRTQLVTMALKPVLKIKVDELFLRWLGDPETQQVLRENLQQIAHGEMLTQPSPRSGVMHKPSSPRHRPGSPTLSASSSKLPSPRSPRRPLAAKNNHKLAVNTSSDGKVCGVNCQIVSSVYAFISQGCPESEYPAT